MPLRICVTGTRGKSSVTRLIASSLRESGLCVLAKTTGSKPVAIFPDGREEEIRRRGRPSVLEQKRLLRLGVKLGIDVLVCEMMGIHPESGYSESTQIIQPQIMVITNVRLDHLAQMGSSKERIARVFSSWIPEGSTVFIPQGEFYPDSQKLEEERKSKIIRVSQDLHDTSLSSVEKFPFFEWKENISLALAVARFLKVDQDVAMHGMTKSLPDFGSLKLWKADWSQPSCSCDFVSCFAANDPESTGIILSSLRERGVFQGKKIVGLLNLRGDRGDRTLQWVRAFKEGAFSEFSQVYLVGLHARAFRRKFKGADKESFSVLKIESPERIMSCIMEKERGECLVVGMGNIGGTGEDLINHWESGGKSYGL